MLGNEAIARGAYEAGVKVSAAYPGTPSTEISENIAHYDEIYAEWSPNEKVATEVAIGASISGVRAMASMKHVGVNVASDPLYTISYGGVNGGLVLVAAVPRTNRIRAVSHVPQSFLSWNHPTARKQKTSSNLPMKLVKNTTHRLS